MRLTSWRPIRNPVNSTSIIVHNSSLSFLNMNYQQATTTEIEKLADLLQQAITENDKDSVQIHLWNIDILFKQLKPTT